MHKTKNCPICGRDFETNRPNKRYCCYSCKEAGRILQRMKWQENNPDYSKNYMQKYRQKERTNATK